MRRERADTGDRPRAGEAPKPVAGAGTAADGHRATDGTT